MHLTRRRSPIDIHDSWVHVTSIGGDVDSNWRFKSLPSTPFSTPPDEKELEEMFKVAKDSTVCQPIVIPPRNDDFGRPRGDLPQLIGPESSTLPKAGGNRPLHALANGIAAAIAQPDFKFVIGKAPPEPAPEASPTSPRSPGRTMSWQLLSPVTDQRMSLPPIQIPPLDNSSSPGTPVSDEIPTPSSANAHGVVVSPVLESPLSERLQDYIAAYLSTIPLENMRTLETILEDEDDDDSDAQSEHTIVPRDKEKIPDTPVTRSSIYSFHTANASIITSPVSPSESDWPII
ncbi:unnamed protein product [Rhizoctonia solani]|uniref:Uncharacterized protein n=1 Tax=Rhizoctonia solani TaxID=456999 RepID=A0A8H2WRU6_9AGAM|nr:unnamed protein product [Rhizoctonia solani]